MSKLKQRTQLGLLIYVCSYNACFAQTDLHFASKVALIQTLDPENLKCFAEGMRDLTCFWEEKHGGSPLQYTFTYRYKNEQSSNCEVTSHPAEGDKTLYVCQLPKVQHFGSLDLNVFHGNLLLYNRTLFINLVLLLDPPANLTVSRTGKHGELRLSWLPPPLKYMDNSMMYEVSYASAGTRTEKVVQASTDFTLRGLKPDNKYEVQVRVKPDGLTYDGYWSAWSTPVSMTTAPNYTDPLVLALCLIISFILTMLSLTALMYNRRYLLKKMWPLIPSPENKFPGLFNVYGGDFQEWLGHCSGSLWRAPAFFSSEELPAAVEALSEAHIESAEAGTEALEPTAVCLAEASSQKDKTMDEAESELREGRKQDTHDHWLLNQFQPLQQVHCPSSWFSLLESKDTYVTLDQCSQSAHKEAQLDDISEESSTPQVLFAATDTFISHSDLGSLPQSSGSGRLSSQSSFEHPHSTGAPKGLTYASLTVTDSGVSVGYSPMSSSRTGVGVMGGIYNDYKNEILVERGPPFVPFASSGF